MFKLPDIDRGLQKHVIQKKDESFKRFWKKIRRENEKKNPILVYPGLRYTHKKLNFACKIFFFSKNVCLNTKINLQLEKKHKKFLGAISKILGRRHQKNASHTISIYGNCMTSVFFQKTKLKKSKFSVVAAQKTLKFFASSWVDCSKLFFHKKKIKKIVIKQFPYMEIVWVAFFIISFFFPLFMKRYQFRYQNNYKTPLKFD